MMNKFKMQKLLSIFLLCACNVVDIDVGASNTDTNSSSISSDSEENPTGENICEPEPEIISLSLSFDGLSVFDSLSYYNEETCIVKDINYKNFELNLECIDLSNISYIHTIVFNPYPKITESEIKISDSITMKTFLEFGGLNPKAFIYISSESSSPLLVLSSAANLPNNLDDTYPSKDFFSLFKFETFVVCDEQCNKENCTCISRGALKINNDTIIYDANQGFDKNTDMNFYVSDIKFINIENCKEPVEFPSSVITFLGVR